MCELIFIFWNVAVVPLVLLFKNTLCVKHFLGEQISEELMCPDSSRIMNWQIFNNFELLFLVKLCVFS